MALISYQLMEYLLKDIFLFKKPTAQHRHKTLFIYLFILQISTTSHAENVTYRAGAGVALVLKKK